MPITINKALRNRLERIYLFANTDYFVRYYGSKLGILWAFLNPFLQIVIYYFAFSYLIFRQRDTSFVLYLFTGIITWQFFAEASKTAITLFQRQRYILQNIDLPKIDFFWSLILSKLWGYFINFLIFLAFSLIFFHNSLSFALLWVIPIWIGLAMFTIGVCFYLATLYIFLRDLDHLWSIVIMAGFWTVPIIWDYKIIFQGYEFMMYNPLTTFVVQVRQVTLQNQMPDLKYLSIALFISAFVAISGYFFMKYKSKKALEFL